jgi:acyl-CoA synthetase (AMP-forming)/AMP-acid ligase II
MMSVIPPSEPGHGPHIEEKMHHNLVPAKQAATTESVVLPRTIDELMRTQAEASPHEPVVSYPSSSINYVDYSVRQLDTFAYRVAQQYKHDFPPRTSSSQKATVIALLGVSDFDYIITLLALTKLGHTVLLLSPRISQPAYAHLLTKTGSKHLIIQPSFQEKASDLQAEFSDLFVREIATQAGYGHPVTEAVSTNMSPNLELDKEMQQIAWIFHSSGSTGLPKPVHIKHRGALSNYRRNMDQLGLRSFLTLPLFHTHGISSLFRAIITGKQIHIYNAALPLTKQHLINCMKEHKFEIFCAVPFALKLLSESPEGVELLRRLKLVTFGGSPCPDALGDDLTERGVKLVTIYGM